MQEHAQKVKLYASFYYIRKSTEYLGLCTNN